MKKYPFIILFTSLLLISYRAGNQDEDSMKELFNEGQYFFNRGDYQDALHFYLQLLSKDSLNANFNFKAGECYLNIPGKETQAIPHFKIAEKKIVPKKSYNKRDFGETDAPLHLYFYLGNAYRIDNQLDKALECYKKFMDSPFFWNNYNQDLVEREIRSCERAKIIQDAPLQFEKIKLDSNFNTRFSEEFPVISGDGHTMVFIRRLQFYDAVYYTTIKNGVWEKAVNINPQIISDGDFYPTGLSYDGTKLLLVKRTRDESDICIAYLNDGIWSKAEYISGKINSGARETYATFAPDENLIYLSSNRAGGKGGFDIYASHKLSDGSWSKPKNMGKVINTIGDEQSPCFCYSQQVLFFSSNNHYNMGGYDIFYSRKIGKKWLIPVNLGYPLNNTGDNLGYYPAAGCREGYYTFSKEQDSDIYFIKIKSENVLNYKDLDTQNK